mgnify:CR=1 FL=1|jgi:plastocyanin
MKPAAAAVVSLFLSGLVPAGIGAQSAAAATHTITIEAMAYSPATLKVKRGDTVIWVNKDPFPHTATAPDRGFDSAEIASEKRWTYVARTRGTHPYVCTLHPTMKGTLVVE